MNKKSVLWILLDLVFLIVFNTVFFVAGGMSHVPSVWIAYGFIHFSYIMVLVTPFLIRKSSSAAVFGFSIYSISATYFFVEFIVGAFFIILKQDSYKPSLITQIIKSAASKVKLLMGKMNDKKANKEIEKAYDALHSSPTKSNNTVRDIETNIKLKIDELESAVSTQNATKVQEISTALISLIQDRNQKLRQQN